MKIVHFGRTVNPRPGHWDLFTYCGDNGPEAFIELDDASEVTCQDCLRAMEMDGIEWCKLCGEELNEDGDCRYGCTVGWTSG